MKSSVIAAVAVTGLVLSVACDSKAATPSGPTRSATVAPQPAVATEAVADAPSAFESLLARVPDNPATRESLLITDIAAVRRFAGIEIPTADASGQAVVDYVERLYRVGRDGPEHGPMTIIPADYGWIIGFNRNAPDFSPYPYLGVDARNAHQIAMYQTVPALPVEIVLGRYDPDTVAGRLAGCAECAPATTIEQDGVSFRAWGKDAWCEDNWCDLNEKLQSKLKPPAFDFIGHGGRIWVGDGFAVRTSQTADMQEVIRVSSGRAPVARR